MAEEEEEEEEGVFLFSEYKEMFIDGLRK